MRRRTMWFVGQGRWSNLLARAVNEHGTGRFVARSVELDGVRMAMRTLSMRHVAPDDVVIRVGFRPAAKTWRGRGFDLVWRALRVFRPRMTPVMYWIGTDVLNALGERQGVSGGAPIRRVAGSRAMHIAGAPWLVTELKTLGVEAEFVPIPWLYAPVPEEAPPFPETFTVTSYVPDSRRDFYGWQMIRAAAVALPEVRFRIVSGTGPGPGGAPENVEFLGWVSPMDPVYRATTIVARLPEHDAIGGTVLEGLAYARPVLYSYEFDHCRYVPHGDAEAFISVVKEYYRQWRDGSLTPNEAGRELVISRFQPERAVAKLESLVGAEGAAE